MNGPSRMPRGTILVGDALHELRRLPEGSVDMALTSPPYFRLRDYGQAGQLGLEGHVDEWVGSLRAVAAEVHRVLTPTGSLWLNVGDTYANRGSQGAQHKSLLLGPERLALALVTDGWRLRNKIVWHKVNHLPTPVPDRLACAWEALYVFVKQDRYYFNLDALRVPHRSKAPRAKPGMFRSGPRAAWRGPNSDGDSGLKRLKALGRVGHPLGKNPGDVWQIAASNYRGSHRATFPVALAELAVRAGCPEARCIQCRRPWRRPVARQVIEGIGETAVRGALTAQCDCGAEREPGLVLDPFFGAGTTALGALENRRDWLGIELSPVFACEAAERIAAYRPVNPQPEPAEQKEVVPRARDKP